MRNVSLTLPRGRSIGLLGRNGAGKSTVLRMIGGSILPDEGQIVRMVSVSWPLGFAGGFHGSLTGAQNVRFIARIYGVDTDALIDHVAEFSELGSFMHMPVSTYSSGMRARLAFGTSLGIDFDVYLVDEITSVGDAAFKKKARAAFKARAARADVVMVSHGPAVIRDYCDSGIVLEDGSVTYYENVEDALAHHSDNMKRPVPIT
ncbi:MAG: ABC transporter ATP-binding protein [Halieaceae bacterium]|nr:ABC transporter ATP-binding protein [Halieaceae bacterium]